MPSSAPVSGGATPNPDAISRFTAQSSTAEDLLKCHTVGLVNLSDFRKRRAEALEQKEREAEARSLGRLTAPRGSGATDSDGASGVQTPPRKKKRKAVKGKLSFGFDDGDEEAEQGTASDSISAKTSKSPDGNKARRASSLPVTEEVGQKKRFGPNTAVPIAPKVITKSALQREAQAREQLRKEFLAIQKAVRATDVLIPFVFYDGTNIPGGICKVKKGDHVWLFLDKARKVGAELGVGGAGERASSKREWARVGVDDLMLVRGEIIIPHHYELYYFIVNKNKGPSGFPLFDFSSQPTLLSPDPAELENIDHTVLSHGSTKRKTEPITHEDESLEGFKDDPTMTKVVDRRWYERNKHIFPASTWEEFDPGKDYSKAVRRDTGGNAFFFS